MQTLLYCLYSLTLVMQTNGYCQCPAEEAKSRRCSLSCSKQDSSVQELLHGTVCHQRSLHLFESLHLPQDFLFTPSRMWSERDDYIAARKIVSTLKVGNDCAEHAVKLASDFNEALTKNDKQCQLLYHVVEHHRKLLPTNAATNKQPNRQVELKTQY